MGRLEGRRGERRLTTAFYLPARCVLLLALLFMTACSRTGPEVLPGVSLELARHRAAAISGLSYQLRFTIPRDADEGVDGEVRIAFELADDSVPLQLDFRAAADSIDSVLTNGTASEYRLENEHIVVPSSELARGSNEIEIHFVAGSGSLNRNPDFLYTLFVPDRARTAFPLFDQPDLKATYELTLVVPTGWLALSNAPIEATSENGETTEYRFRRSDLISSYLFSFVAGRFQSVTRERSGRSMTMLHRETDEAKVERNLEAIFDLHATSIEWLEAYTNIDYPFQKFDFVLIPAFQYGGMEHVGGILYDASRLLLDESPSDTELIARASVIAHETAHMWFGDLVTIAWFNDVWMKEVFANFMAAKIVNPSFPDIDHDLSFLVDNYPAAYAADRTEGATPIRQELSNLNEAGQLYGPIIYNKAPIMMRQLETLIGADEFAEGISEYLRRFSFGNATWPALIDILDRRTNEDLRAWSEVWVETAGRPEFSEQWETTTEGIGGHYLIQYDGSGRERVWPQQFEVMAAAPGGVLRQVISSTTAATTLGELRSDGVEDVVFNSDGLGYGLFPAGIGNLLDWDELTEIVKGSELINLYENLLVNGDPDAAEYFGALRTIVNSETNQLILDLALSQLRTVYWNLLPNEMRRDVSVQIEDMLWQSMLDQTEASVTKIYFDAFADIATSPDRVRTIYEVWSGRATIEGLSLSENDLIRVTQLLAIKMPDLADELIATQLARTENPDSRRRLEFVAPSLSAEQRVRDQFFDSLADERNRRVEPWVLDALRNLHHPLRTAQSEKYLLPSLELLQEIQVTGDIFFPANWLNATLRNYRSASAVRTVRTFLEQRPDYNERLRVKILQSADLLFRASMMSADEGSADP